MNVPTHDALPLAATDAGTIARALDDAARFRRGDQSPADGAQLAAYGAVAERLRSGRTVVLSSRGASRLADDGRMTLGLADVVTLLGALRDAAAWRLYRAGAWCAECAAAPDHVCSRCVREVDLADSYAALSRALGGAELPDGGR
jgi:hypothetical protein